MGTLLDSLGAASVNWPNFGGTDLARYNNAVVGSFSLGDAAGSEYAMSDFPGLPLTALEVDGVTLGTTGIIGSGTAMDVTNASTGTCTFLGNWKPMKSTGLTFSLWFETSTDPSTTWDIIGFDDGSSTDRLKLLWNDTNNRFDWFDISTFRQGFTPATSYAVDVADGSPHHLVARYRNGVFDVFFDGSKGNSVTSAWTADPANNANQLFGMFPAGTAALTGVFQHVTIWSAGISDDAVSDLYNSGSGRFADGT